MKVIANFARVSSIGILCLLVHSAFGQSNKKLFTEKGEFYPAPKSVSYRMAAASGFSTVQTKAMYDNMAAFLELVHHTPCLHPPRGFAVSVWATVCEDGTCSDTKKAIAGESGILVLDYTVTDKDPVPHRAEEGPSIRMFFNDIRTLLRKGSSSRDGFYEPKIVSTVADCPVYEGGYLVLTKSKKPLFMAVTKETTLKNDIKELEEDIEKVRSSGVKSKDIDNWMTVYNNKLQAKKKELTDLSAEERKAPATVGREKIVVPNPDFFDQAKKPSDLQLVIIDLYKYNLKKYFTDDLIREIRKTIDIPLLLASLK